MTKDVRVPRTSAYNAISKFLSLTIRVSRALKDILIFFSAEDLLSLTPEPYIYKFLNSLSRISAI